MSFAGSTGGVGRRDLLKAGLVVGVSQLASPFVLRAHAADAVKIGLDNPLTGPLGGSERTN
ncbi:MAG: hypothetical protein ABSE69_11865 [Roseiarcus sp.]|jgi:hypothetical protein